MSVSQPFRIICAAPRSHLFVRSSLRLSTTTRLPRSQSTPVERHNFSTSIASLHPSNPRDVSPFSYGPSPPRLPKEEQEIFEALQRQSTGAFSTPRATPSPPEINQSPDSTASERAEAASEISSRVDQLAASAGISDGETAQSQSTPNTGKDDFDRVIEARGKGEELHPNVRRGAQPEFEGDVNPRTGEVGGPKNEPLRWGSTGEWTYNGRATDF